MINQVQIHSNQQMALGDVMKLQSFVDDTFQHLIMDAITNERLYVGLTISEFTPTQIQIAAGRLWDGPTGKIYDLAEAHTVSVQTNLPVADERWLAVSVVGQQVDAAQTVVSILIDAENEDWESQTEYTEKHRQAAVHITAGIEAPDPQKPTVPTGYLLIGYVRLTTTGVAEIQMAENQILKSLWEVYQQVLGHQVMLDVIEPKISTLISDLAQLAKQIRGTAYQDMLMNLAQDVGHLKDLAELPDSYSLYGGDDYLDDSESDTGNAEYLARIDEGIRFAWAGQTEQQPALFNTYDASVTDFDGLILPAGQKVVRLNITDGYAGGLSISQYQQQTHTMKTGQRQKRRIRYGPTRKVCTNSNNWRNGKKSPVGSVFEANGATWVVKERWGEHSGHWWMRVQQIWERWTPSVGQLWGLIKRELLVTHIVQMGLIERQGGVLLLAVNQPVPSFRPGLLFQPIVHFPGGLVAQGLVQSLMVVEVDVMTDSGLGLFYSVVCFEINLLVFKTAPEALHEDIVHEAALAVHADFNFSVQQ